MGYHFLRPEDQFSTTVSRFRRVAYFWANFGAALGLCWAVLGLAKGGVGARWRLPWPPFCALGVPLASPWPILALVGRPWPALWRLSGAFRCLFEGAGRLPGVSDPQKLQNRCPHHWRIHGKRYLVNVPSVDGVPWICAVSTG